LWVTISNNNYNISKKDLIDLPYDSYNTSGIDARELTENEKKRLISILKEEFLINS
jgi:hypothetical protein